MKEDKGRQYHLFVYNNLPKAFIKNKCCQLILAFYVLKYYWNFNYIYINRTYILIYNTPTETVFIRADNLDFTGVNIKSI